MDSELISAAAANNITKLARLLERAGNANAAAWLNFGNGHWTKEKPSREGVYIKGALIQDLLTQDPRIEVSFPPLYVYRQKGKEGLWVLEYASQGMKPVEELGWKGYIWSEPLAHFPINPPE